MNIYIYIQILPYKIIQLIENVFINISLKDERLIQKPNNLKLKYSIRLKYSKDITKFEIY